MMKDKLSKRIKMICLSWCYMIELWITRLSFGTSLAAITFLVSCEEISLICYGLTLLLIDDFKLSSNVCMIRSDVMTTTKSLSVATGLPILGTLIFSMKRTWLLDRI